MLEFIERPAEGDARLLMVWLHGLGADAWDLEPVAAMLGVHGVRHVLPNAPVRSVTINGGMGMRAWYDIAAPDLRWREDADGMADSVQQVCALIEHLRGTQPLPVVLAGFSQGAVISLLCAGSLNNLAGVAALSGYAAASLDLATLKDIPVFMVHGTQDPVIAFDFARDSAQRIAAAGANMEWHEYAMPHSICQEEIADLARWLGQL